MTLVVSLLGLLLTHCTRSDPRTVSASISISARELQGPAEPAQGLHRAASRPSALSFSFTDVQQIRMDVKQADTHDVLFANIDLSLSAGVWSGTLPFLPQGRRLVFTARAYDGTGTLLFQGSTEQTLFTDREQVLLLLSPGNDGQEFSLPRIAKIFIPGALISNESGNISFFVEANANETLTYTLTSPPGGGSFQPDSGTLHLSGSSLTFVSRYTPPPVDGSSSFEHSLKVTNSQGNSISTTFKVQVIPPGSTEQVRDSTVRILFNPVIQSIATTRVLGTNSVDFEAFVSDDKASTELTYAWSLVPTGTPTPAPAFTRQDRTSTLTNYTEDLQGLVLLSVTDGDGGKTTLQYPLAPHQYPDNPIVESPPEGLSAVAAGGEHTCALFNGGWVRCWGLNSSGQLGYGHVSNIGDDELPYTAGDVPLPEVGIQLAVGGYHTCVLLGLGAVRCWGLNSHGQLGYGHTQTIGDDEAATSQGYVNLGGIAARLTAGLSHTCALMDTGKVRCWGSNQYGQLGYGQTSDVGDDESPATAGDVQVGGSVRDVVAGGYHTCALMDSGQVRCWGRNDSGQLGLGNTTPVGDKAPPSSVAEINLGGRAVRLSAGLNHTCAVLETGALRCWGNNDQGQLGYGTLQAIGDDESPAQAGDVKLGARVLQVAAGNAHTCALLADGSVTCWGQGTFGGLGLGDSLSRTAPPSTPVDLGGLKSLQITAGGNHTCVLLTTAQIRCWGLGSKGQLGYGNTATVGDNEAPSLMGDLVVPTPSGTPPDLVSLSPPQARAGAQLILVGTGFVAQSLVQIGSVPCSPVSFLSSSSLSCTVPLLADGTYPLLVTNPDARGSVLPGVFISDNTPPTGGGTLKDGTFSASLTASPPLTWTAFTDAGSGVDHVEYAVGTSVGGTQLKGWTPFTPTAGPGVTLTGLTLTNGKTYYPSIRVLDRAGNSSVLSGDGWTVDSSGPSAPVLDDGASTNVPTASPKATWTASVDPGSGVAFYEVAIGTSPGGTEVLSWTNVGNVTSDTRTGLTLTVGTIYYTSVRAIDALGNVGAVASGDGWTCARPGPTVLVLLPMDNPTSMTGENASVDFVNYANAGASFHSVGTPSISTVSPKVGSGSGRFARGYLQTTDSAANVIGNSDFTIEFWVRYSGTPDGSDTRVVSGTGWDISLAQPGSYSDADFAYLPRWYSAAAVGWGVLQKNTWYHLSLSRAGTTLYTHLNGVLKQTASIPADTRLEGDAITSLLTVGSLPQSYLDDLIITVGGVRHTTANFTLTTAGPVPLIYLPLDGPGDGDNVSADFRNAAPGPVTLSATSGAPSISSASAGCGGCGDFTSGTLATPVSATTTLGNRDFTIEFWVKTSTHGDGSPVVSGGSATTPYWDIALGNSYNGYTPNFAFYPTESGGLRYWGGDIGWGPLALDTWTHLSLTRLGTSLLTHKNGLLVETKTILATDRMEGPSVSSSAITVGGQPCLLDDLMITVGTARHTAANFAVVRATNHPRLAVTGSPLVVLPLDGTNGSTTFTNYASGEVFSAVGAPVITTATSKSNGASGNFKGGYLATAASSANVIGNRDFTIECWVNTPALTWSDGEVVSGSGWAVSLGNQAYNNSATFTYGGEIGRWWGGPLGWGVMPLNTWVHLAISRSRNMLYTHKNGVFVEAIPIGPDETLDGASATSSVLTVGATPSFMDDVMITVGSAKYSMADFAVGAPPARPFMLLPMDGANLSTSFPNLGTGPGVSVTAGTTPKITTADFVYGGASANLTAGTLTTSASSANLLGTKDFTLEFWVKTSSLDFWSSTALSGTGWDISLGNTHYNPTANFAYYATVNGGYREWGGDVDWGVLPLNTWVHLSLSRSGTRLYTHKNGVFVSSKTISASDTIEGPSTTSTLLVGSYPLFMDHLLITVGRTLHTTANFPVWR